jgi:hypothetical protein
MLSSCGTCLRFALRRAYGRGTTRTSLRCIARSFCAVAVIQLYRFILFLTTFYAI